MRPNFVSKRLKYLIPKIGGKLLLEPQYKYSGCIIFDNGTRTFFKESSFDINPHGAVKIAIDKGYANYFLEQFGFNIPTFDTFANAKLNQHLSKKKGIQEAYDFALKLGFPVIIKPNDGTKGTHVYKVYDKTEYFDSATRLFADAKVMLVQKFVTGHDYRIVVFDNKVYCAYRRIPLHIVGNGADNIKTLLQKKAKELQQQTSINSINPEDERIQANLLYENLSLKTIPTKGQIIPLLHLANLSLGGTAVDYTDKISPEYKALAIDITQKMGLRFCGIDIMTDSIEGKITDYSIIEINAAPGQSNFAALGYSQSKLVDELYLAIFLAIKTGSLGGGTST